ncbi:MAG TPA: apolipoprotein N-acyltransferase [Acidimicrobiales bacterium]|nr:apolipoprotein N-acyltransferase [Acidimicrobiales bacterium]
MRWRILLLGGLAGALVALSIPPFGFWPLGWLGLAVLAYPLPATTWRQRAGLGIAFGLVDYIIGLLWVQEFSVPGFIGVVLISTIYAALAVAIVPSRHRIGIAVGLPSALVLSDWARDRFPVGGLPLSGISLGQASGPLAPVLRLGGSLALTAETALVGVALAEVVRLVIDRLRPSGPAPAPDPGAMPTSGSTVPAAQPTGRAAGLPAAALVAAVLLPVVAFVSPSGAGGHIAPLRIGLVQGGGPRGTRAIASDPQLVFLRHQTASRMLTGPLDLIVWPEGIVPDYAPYLSYDDDQAMASLATADQATVLAGVEKDLSATKAINEVQAWGPAGNIVGTYVKNHLVPFGEYVPYRSFFEKFVDLKDVPYDAVPGHQPGFLRTPAGPLAIMISYEVFFDERARGGVRAGGQVLVVPTNTASYRSTQVPTQEVAADRMRAWETGRWLVQVTPTGYSTVVSPTGQVEHKTYLDRQQVIEATVPMRTGYTIYDHIGDLSVMLLALAAWLAVAGLSRSKEREETEPVSVPA